LLRVARVFTLLLMNGAKSAIQIVTKQTAVVLY